MSNPTSNFGWQMPTNTDLVSQLPADFEVFGQAVDTSLADLKGGTTGQVLKKNTNADMDFVWSADAAGMTNPMTTTGDTIYSSSGSTPARLGIGTTGQVLAVSGGLPAWTTVAGSALTLIKARTTFSSVATTGTTFDNVFSSTYFNYIIVIDQTSAVTANDTLVFRYRSGGTTYSGGNYYSGYSNVTWNGTSAPVGNSGGTYISIGTLASGFNNASYTVNFYSPNAASSEFKIAYSGYSPQLQGYVYGAGFLNTTTTNYDGFILSCSTNNILSMGVTVYGLAKA